MPTDRNDPPFISVDEASTIASLKADLDVALRTLDVVTKERDAMKPIVAKYRKIKAIVDALPGEAADGVERTIGIDKFIAYVSSSMRPDQRNKH